MEGPFDGVGAGGVIRRPIFGFGHRDRTDGGSWEFLGQDYHNCRVLSRRGRQNAGGRGALLAAPNGVGAEVRTRDFERTGAFLPVNLGLWGRAEREEPCRTHDAPACRIACRGIFIWVNRVCVCREMARLRDAFPGPRGRRVLAIR